MIDVPAAETSDDELANAPMQPKLLFPSAPKPALRFMDEPCTPSRSPKKASAANNKPSFGFIPPTPQTLSRHRRQKSSGSSSLSMGGGGKSPMVLDSDDDELLEQGDVADVFGGETFRPPPRDKLRQGQEFARKAGGLFFR